MNSEYLIKIIQFSGYIILDKLLLKKKSTNYRTHFHTKWSNENHSAELNHVIKSK